MLKTYKRRRLPVAQRLRRLARISNHASRKVTMFLNKPSNRLFLAAIAFAAICGCGAQTVPLSGNGIPPAVPAITVTPGTLAFGDVTLGQSTTQPVTVSSTGTANLVISAITISGSEFVLTTPPTLPLTLAPGTGKALNVAFDPTVAGNANGALAFTSNATTAPVSTVAITGAVVTATVDLTWQAPAPGNDPAIAYNVYRGAHGSGIFVAVATNVLTVSYADPTGVTGQTYDYVVKSVDAQGNLSLPSNVYTAVIP